MKRREMIAGFGGAAAATPLLWPLAGRAQQQPRARRVGVLLNLTANDPESARRILAFGQAMQRLGWSEGRNLQIDVLWGGSDVVLARRYVTELIAAAPDVILGAGAFAIGPLLQMTGSVPIVFVQ